MYVLNLGGLKKIMSTVMEMIMSVVNLIRGKEFWKLHFVLRGGQWGLVKLRRVGRTEKILCGSIDIKR